MDVGQVFDCMYGEIRAYLHSKHSRIESITSITLK
jgi:hypothetical protein